MKPLMKSEIEENWWKNLLKYLDLATIVKRRPYSTIDLVNPSGIFSMKD